MAEEMPPRPVMLREGDVEVLATLRRALLAARTRDGVLDAVRSCLEERLGLTPAAVVVVPGTSPCPDGFIEVAREQAQGPIAACMNDRSIARAWVVPLDRNEVLVASAEQATPADAARTILRELAEDVRHALALVGAQDVVAGLRRDVEQRDALLREAGNALIKDAAEVVNAVASLERRDAMINADLQQALRFQRAMLARPPAFSSASVELVYLPAELISGDFYDVSVLAPDWMRVFVADAAGHGVAAGLATMFIKSAYEAHKVTGEPAATLAAMNDALATTYHRLELRFTAICVDIHPRAGRVSYATGAHPGPLLARIDGVETLESGGSFVGITPGIEFPQHETHIGPADVLVAFTDGLVDATSQAGEIFGEERMTEIVARTRGADTSSALVRAVADFVGEGRGLPDDITIVSVAVGQTY